MNTPRRKSLKTVRIEMKLGIIGILVVDLFRARTATGARNNVGLGGLALEDGTGIHTHPGLLGPVGGQRLLAAGQIIHPQIGVGRMPTFERDALSLG